jgi:hypothetical protein
VSFSDLAAVVAGGAFPSVVAAKATPTSPTAPTQVAETATPARIVGAPIVAGGVYRLQLASFQNEQYAAELFRRMQSLGIVPAGVPYKLAWVRGGGYYRVVLTGVRAQDINDLAERLGQADFTEVLAQREGDDTP